MTLHPSSSLALAAALLLTPLGTIANPSPAEPEWPAWRGDGTGLSTEKLPSLTWGPGEHVKWSTKVPGYGWSSPVVGHGRIYLTTAITDDQRPPQRKGPGGGEPPLEKTIRWELHAYDAATGHPLWTHLANEAKPQFGNHISNTFASETPVTDGERVVAWFGMAGVAVCCDASGRELWTRDLGAHKTFANWGTSSSPALDDGRVFIQCDNEERSYLAALDLRTGKDLWRIDRRERSTWSTPIIWRNTKRTELVCMGSDYIRGYDPATGRELWRLPSERHLDPSPTLPNTASPASSGTSTGAPPPPPSTRRSPAGNGPRGGPPAGGAGGPPPRGGGPGGPGNSRAPGGGGGGKSASGGCKASPVASRDLLFVGMSGKTHDTELGPMWAIEPGASGELSLGHGVAWFRSDAGPHFTSAVVHEGRLYVFPPHDRGVLSCFDARTGATLYTEPLPGAAGFKASPCVVDGRILCSDESGTTYVVEAGPKFRLLARNPLEEMIWASPAITRGSLFLRTTDHLFSITP